MPFISYNDDRGGEDFLDFGIGYQKGTRKLVAFNIPKVGVVPTNSAPLEFNDITLIDSLEWLEKILNMDERLGICIQFGTALAEWFGELRSALEEGAQRGESRKLIKTNAKYWEKWEQLGLFHTQEWVCRVVKDTKGKIHLIKTWTTIDGKKIPNQFATARHFFEFHEVPYDGSRVGQMVCDKQMSLKKALKIWIEATTPTDLQKFLAVKYTASDCSNRCRASCPAPFYFPKNAQVGQPLSQRGGKIAGSLLISSN